MGFFLSVALVCYTHVFHVYTSLNITHVIIVPYHPMPLPA